MNDQKKTTMGIEFNVLNAMPSLEQNTSGHPALESG